MMRRILCFMIVFSITFGVLTKTEGFIKASAATNFGELPTWVTIGNVTNDKMKPGPYTASDSTIHANTHGIVDFTSLAPGNVTDLIGTGFNFTCNTCCDWRYCIKFNNTGSTTTTTGQNNGTGRSRYVIVDIDISLITTPTALVNRILGAIGANLGGHIDMVLTEGTNGTLVIASTTSNDTPSIGSGYLMSGIWSPNVSSGPYRYGDWSYDILNDLGIVITGYDGKEKYVTIPNGILVFNKSTNEYEILPVVAIGDYAFNRTKSINVTIPDTVSSIGRGAFYYCTSLTNVTIPDSVKVIDAIAFFNCIKLTNVTLPSKLESIGKDAFSGCKALRDLYFLSASPPIMDAPFFWGIGGTIGIARAIVPNGSKNAYSGTGIYWNDLLVIEDDSIGIKYTPNTDIILTGITASSSVTTPIKYDNGDFEINLTKETITFAWGFEVKAYSLDGGVKWTNVKSGIFHESKFPKLLDKGMTLVVSDKAIDKGKAKPGEEAVTVAFPPIAKRQSQVPPKAYPNQMNLKKLCVQPIISKNSPSTDPTWYISLSKADSTPINVSNNEFLLYQNFFIKSINRVVEIGVAAGNTVNSKGYGQIPTTAAGQMDSMPRQSLQGQPPKKTYIKYWEYVIRFAPAIINVNGENVAVAASKPRKIKVQSIQ